MNCAIKKKKDGKPFKYVDYLEFGSHTVAPVSTEYDEREVNFSLEIDESEENGRIPLLLSEKLTCGQLCGPDGEEIYVEGKDLYDYIDPVIVFDDMGERYEYVCDPLTELELESYQIYQIDDLCEAANNLLTTMNSHYEWDMQEIGELLDTAEKLLHDKGMNAYYPAVVTDGDVQYSYDVSHPAKKPSESTEGRAKALLNIRAD